ncbi:MAG: DUF2933 domain-containing protein [Chloroflexi bacterium]|nr:DUF2933 domain-containing protein [Chloroflexota bacterium]
MNEVSRLLKGNHALLMVICCVVPMALLAAIFVFDVPVGTVGLFLVMLACPLLHLFMMRGMGHGDQRAGCHDKAPTEQSEPTVSANVPVPAGKKG